MTQPILSQESLRALLHYDPETGVFTWLVTRGGAVAGSQGGYVGNSHYICIRINSKTYQAHRLAWLYITGDWPKDQIDHINHARTDNRFANLREATGSQNQRNRSIGKNNTSGHIGVSFIRSRRKWQATIQKNNKNVYLGTFVNKSDAVLARISANKKYGFHPNHGA